MRILLTNDDGWAAAGLHALAAALGAEWEVTVVAPATNQSGVSRSITLSGELVVDEVEVPGASLALALAGTPVDCVRFAVGGMAGPRPDLVVSGANHGMNLGDDVTYSGTVAAALEGLLLGLPAVAVSQQSLALEEGHPRGEAAFDFGVAARAVPVLVAAIAERGLAPGVVLNVNCPAHARAGARLSRLGKRVYRTGLDLVQEDGGRRVFRIRGGGVDHPDPVGTDIEAIGEGRVAVTPLHYALDLPHGRDALAHVDLERLR